METKPKKREWVKTAAIIFLSVLLVLTLFSNTIMNMSLTEVATQEVTSGSITAKVRGTGTVTAIGNAEIKSKGTTTVASVKVKSGQEVNEGDILFIMGEQSEELEKAEEELQSLEFDLQSVQASYPLDTTSMEINAAIDALNKAKDREADAYASYLSCLDSDTAKALEEAKAALSNAQNQYSDYSRALDDARDLLLLDLQSAEAAYRADPSEANKQILDAAQEAYDDSYKPGFTLYDLVLQAQDDIFRCETEVERYESEFNQYKNDYDNAAAAVVSAQAKLDSLINGAAVSQAQANHSSASTYVTALQLMKKIEQQKEKIAKLQGGEENAIKAPASGTVSSVEVSSGSSVAKDDILAVIEVPDMGYTVSFAVTNDQAKRLKIGDSATVSNFYWGQETKATISSIKTDPKNPQTKKIITFDIDGNVTSGSELTIAVGQKSASYDVIVPASAVRTDSNGTFVLRVEAKNSALGNRYFLHRVAVEVLATDDVSSALSGDLSYGDFVVTTSSAPVKSGEQVRMADLNG